LPSPSVVMAQNLIWYDLPSLIVTAG